jgi:hypothetical protein
LARFGEISRDLNLKFGLKFEFALWLHCSLYSDTYFTGLCTNMYQFTAANIFQTSSPILLHPTNVFHREH